MKKVLLIFVVFIVGLNIVQASPRYWVSPATCRSDFWNMFKPIAKWDSLLSKTDVFSIHVNAITARTDTNLIRLATKKLNDAGVEVNFECGGLRPFSGCDSMAGETQAQFELINMTKWMSYGGKIDFVTMDSPINTMIKGGDPSGTCDWTVERTANEIVDYMKAVRRKIPNVVFCLVEPIPWYRVGNYPSHPGNDYGDLIETLDTVFNIVDARGEKIEIFHSDSPYEYSENAQTQGWLKIKAVEDWLHARGIRHGRINNSQEGGFTSDQLYYERTIDSYKKYKSIGGNPDEIEVWCWYEHPAVNEPDNQPYSFTYTCRELIENSGNTPPLKKALLEPEDGRVYHGVQTMTYESGDPLAGYLGALNDATIQPAVRGYFMGIPSERGPNLPLSGLKKFLKSADSIGFIPELSFFLIGNGFPSDSIFATTNQYDWIVDSAITLCKSYNRRMFLRIGGEFNGSGPGWNGGGYHPYLYVSMFRKIVDMFASRGFRDSISINWCYEPDAGNDFDSVDARGARWYPGDNYVDWFGLDVFDAEHFDQSLPDFKSGVITKKGKSERFLQVARDKKKPVYLSETSAKAINVSNDYQDGIDDWNNWFEKFWTFIDNHKEIKGFNYIDANWPVSAYAGWGDARIENSPYIVSKYKEEMKNPKYIHLSSSPSDIKELEISAINNHSVFIYPNPAFDFITITCIEGEVEIINTLGITIWKGNIVSGQKIDISNLGDGIYFLKIINGNSIEIKKFVIMR